MLYFSDLTQELADKYTSLLQDKAKACSESQSNISSINNPWIKLQELWHKNRISNVVISHSLRNLIVPSYVFNMD